MNSEFVVKVPAVEPGLIVPAAPALLLDLKNVFLIFCKSPFFGGLRSALSFNVGLSVVRSFAWVILS